MLRPNLDPLAAASWPAGLTSPLTYIGTPHWSSLLHSSPTGTYVPSGHSVTCPASATTENTVLAGLLLTAIPWGILAPSAS